MYGYKGCREHPGLTRPIQHPHHYSLQETNIYRPISTLGQQQFHRGQTQCLQHIGTQGQNSIT